MKTIEEAQQRLVDHRVMTDAERELVELALGGQLPVQEQIAHFGKAALRGQLLDRVATVQQDAGIPVDVGDLAFAGSGQAVAGIKRECAEFLVQRRDVDDAGAHRSGTYRQFGLFATGAIDELELALIHVIAASTMLARGIHASPASALHGPLAESRQRELNSQQVRAARCDHSAQHGKVRVGGCPARPAQGSPEGAQRPAAAAAYFLRNLSTRPAVSTIFCLPV